MASAAPARFLAATCCLALIAPFAKALIVPQELPTVLSVLYSNIPPILKGTDSRFGVGFRFGPHADFQVLLELGPQQYTQRLGPDPGDSKRRRQVPRLPAPAPAPTAGGAAPDTIGSRWLSAWRSGLVNPSQNTLSLYNSPVPSTINSITAPEENVMMKQLKKLYEKKPETTTTLRASTITTTTDATARAS